MIDEWTGAVGSSRRSGWISNAIILFERLRDRPHWYSLKLGAAGKSHSYLYINRHVIYETTITKGMRKKPAKLYDGIEKSIFIPTFLDAISRHNMKELAGYLLGDKYGWKHIPLFALDGIFRTYWFTKKAKITNFKVCSHTVGWLYQKTPIVCVNPTVLYNIYKGVYNHPKELNYKFGCDWKNLNPDKLEDWMASRPNEWRGYITR